MDRFGLRVGAATGWVAVLGVAVGLVAIPMAIAGQPPSLSATGAEALAYFGHRELLWIEVLSPLIAIAMIPFGVVLRGALRSSEGRAALLADLGLAALVVAIPLYVISSALASALVGEATRGAVTFDSLFRLYSLLYDGAADFLEGAWVGAFALAMLAGPGLRWLGWLGVLVGLSRWVKALAPAIALPDAFVMVGSLAFLVWFAATVVWLTRLATRAQPASASLVAEPG